MILAHRAVSVMLAVPLLLAGLALAPAPADAADDLTLAQAAESARGRLVDPAGEPMPGVAIVVESADGSFSQETISDEDGAWEIPLPGPGDYIATLDAATLPDGVTLRDPARTSLEVDIRTGQQRTLLFPTGEGTAATAVGDRVFGRIAAGIQFGLIIAITAIGLSLIFGTTGLVNFSHGELVTFGAVVAWFLNAPAGIGAGLPLIAAALIATVATAALGGAIERGLWRPLRRRRTGLIQMLVISIGLMLALRNLLQLWFGGRSLPYFDYTIQESLRLGPVQITPRDLTVIVLSAVTLVGVATMLRTTRIGKAMRAVADNRDLAESSGIDVQQVILIIWVLGAGLAGFGGVMAATVENVSFLLGFRLLLLMFSGIILGGLGTAYGAMVGSIVIGLVTELSTLWFSPELKFVWALLVLILILLVRPQGILGQRERIG
ncbi:MAG: branched-chain amino acid ABC transporter permease [Nitriliruptoraceae bacterium]